MGSIVNQSSKGLVANYIGILLGFVNVMVIMPALLQPEQIGLLNLILSVVFIVFPMLDLSAASLLNRFFPNVESKQHMLHLSLLISGTGALLFVIFFLIGKPFFSEYYLQNSPEIIPYYWLIYGISIIMSWLTLLETYSVIQHKFHVSVFIKEVLFRLLVCFSLGLLYLKVFGFETYIFLHFLMYLISAVVLFLYLKRKQLLLWHFKLPKISVSQRKSMTRYGAFVLLTGFAGVLAIRIDMIMLGAMEGLKDVGIYTIAVYMSTLIDIPRRMILQSSYPIIRMAYKQGDMENVIKIQRKAVLNLMLIAGFMLMMVMVNLNDIYKIIPKGDIYQQGLLVVLFLGLTKIAEMMAGVNNEVLLASKYYYLNIIFVVCLAVLTVAFNLIFIPIDGLVGSAYATLLSSSIVVVGRIFTFHYLFGKNVYSFSNLLIAVFFSVIGLLLYFIPIPFHPIVTIAIKGTLGSLAFYGFLKFTQISPDLIELINGILEKVPMGKYFKL